MKKLKDSFYGLLIITGLLLLGCDTESHCQLVIAVLFGFGLLLLGGRGLILNNKDKS